MARQRMIHPDIWDDDFLGADGERRELFIGLFSMADDEGRHKTNLVCLRKMIFGFRDLTLERIAELMQSLADRGYIKAYCDDSVINHGVLTDGSLINHDKLNEFYVQLRGWSNRQRINRPTPSHIPAFANSHKTVCFRSNKDDSVINHGVLTDGSMSTHSQIKSLKKERNNAHAHACAHAHENLDCRDSEQPPVTPHRGDISLDIISLWERLTKGKLPQVKDKELAAKRISEAYKKWRWKYTLGDWEAAIRYVIKTPFYTNELKPPLKFLLQRTPNGNISQLEYILDKAEPIAAPSIAIPTIPSPPPKFVGYLGTGCKDKEEFDALWTRMNADADALNLRKREEEFRAHLKRHGLSDDVIEERVKINKPKWEKEIHDNRL